MNLRATILRLLLAAIFLAAPALLHAADSFVLRTNKNRIDADITSWPLQKFLEKVCEQTGWKVFIEPGTMHTVSAKFKDLPLADGLRSLLGDLNFAVVTQTNSRPQLFVYRTGLHQATQLVSASSGTNATKKIRGIPNELIVTVKPGVNINDLARALGAKVTGSINGINTYRLQFEDEAAAEAARAILAANPDVASVDSNYNIEKPKPADGVLASSAPELQLKQRAPGDCGIVIGLVDTSMQKLGGGLDNFVMTPISVADGSTAGSGTPTHATSMAETLLRTLQMSSGGSTSAKILPVDVYGSRTTTSTFDVANGIARAVNGGANIINLSLGSAGDSSFLQLVIRKASAQGVVFFAAAGNEPVTTPVYPAAYPEVTAVTAGDRQGQIASYANRGDFVDVVAPGSSIVNYNGHSYYVTGTSAATAFISGLAAGMADKQQTCPSEVVGNIRSQMSVQSTSEQ